MANKKQIPCRVCGKMFEPCSYCQSHSDIFRWRNFACSRECATKYINEAIAYRESLKNKKDEVGEKIEIVTEEVTVKQSISPKKKISKKISTDIVEDKVENQETK